MLGLCGKHLGPFIPAGGPLRPLGLQGLSAQRSMQLARGITPPQQLPQSLRGTPQMLCSMERVTFYLERREPNRFHRSCSGDGHVCGGVEFQGRRETKTRIRMIRQADGRRVCSNARLRPPTAGEVMKQAPRTAVIRS